MVGMFLREFECTLCQKPFTMMSGDLMIPQPRICDECLKTLWHLEGDALAQQVTTMMVEHATPPGVIIGIHADEQDRAASVVQLVQWDRERWNTLDEAIQDREQYRQTSG